jgi:hypothetical protein
MTGPGDGRPLTEYELDRQRQLAQAAMEQVYERRKKALAGAREHLSGLPAWEQLDLDEQVALEQEVAAFLLGERPRLPEVPGPAEESRDGAGTHPG